MKETCFVLEKRKGRNTTEIKNTLESLWMAMIAGQRMQHNWYKAGMGSQVTIAIWRSSGLDCHAFSRKLDTPWRWSRVKNHAPVEFMIVRPRLHHPAILRFKWSVIPRSTKHLEALEEGNRSNDHSGQSFDPEFCTQWWTLLSPQAVIARNSLDAVQSRKISQKMITRLSLYESLPRVS